MKRRLSYIVNGMGLRSKFLVSYLLIITVACIMFILNIYSTARSNEEQSLYTARQLVSQCSSFLEYQTQGVRSKLDLLAYNDGLLTVFNRKSSAYEGNTGLWFLDAKNITSLTHVATTDRDAVSLTYYLSESLAGFAENEDFQLLDRVSDTAWYRDMTTQGALSMWLTPSELSPDAAAENTITYVRKIPSQSNIQESVGLFRFDMSKNSIREILNQSVYTPATSVFVLNSSQNIVCVSDGSDEKIIEIGISQNLSASQTESQWLRYVSGNGIYLFGTTAVPGTDWSVYMAIPYSDILYANISSVVQLIWVLAVTLVLAVSLSIFMSSSITKRIVRLSTAMKGAANDHFNAAPLPEGSDEIGRLSKTFNHMTAKIAKLLKVEYRQGIELKSYEMKALQAQINPHFLYNTLDLIHWMAVDCDAKNIQSAVYNLSQFYKLSLSKGEDVVTLENELAHVTAYVNIQNMRFTGRIELLTEVPTECLNFMCPKIILQPVVENAILHGIMETEEERGTIIIRLCDTADKLLLSVEDNGAGMDTAVLQGLLPRQAQVQKHGYGLMNIDQRLKLYYGDDCGISIQSELGQGTCVTLMLRKILRLPLEE